MISWNERGAVIVMSGLFSGESAFSIGNSLGVVNRPRTGFGVTRLSILLLSGRIRGRQNRKGNDLGMRFSGFLAVFFVMISASMTIAQDRWVQIEAQPTLRQAEERTRAYAAMFPNIQGYAMTTGWYAIVIGPYSPAEADRQLAQLRSERLIPADSYISFGDKFANRFWPVGLPQISTESAVTEAPQPEPSQSTLPDETPAEARRSEALLSTEERMELQEALQWEEHYAGAIDGAIGPGTRRSMADWQSHKGYEATGILTTAQRSEIVSQYREEKTALGLQTVTESEAGIEITLPVALVEFDHYDPPFVHYRAKNDSGLRVLLISQDGDPTTLSGLYTAMQSLEIVPIEGERQLRRTDFVLTGQNANLRSHSEAFLSDGHIKGFSLIWEPKADAVAERILAAMKAGFRPAGNQVLSPGLGEPLSENRADLMSGLEIRKPKMSRSGFYVGKDGMVATTADVVDGCARITLDDLTVATVASRDDAAGFALLQPEKPLSPRATAQFSTGPARPNTEVALAGFSYGDALDAAAISFGTLAGMNGLNGEPDLARLTVAALPGDAGGPVIDGHGMVLGMLLPRGAGAGGRVLPDDTGIALQSSVISRQIGMLHSVGDTEASAGQASPSALTPEALAVLGRDLTVLVSCWE
jgi:S1-C subfamily serine protease/peptidoglycan hydrolase-like protein with peptidoglycan-binding domain